jgi:hypothetical protein
MLSSRVRGWTLAAGKLVVWAEAARASVREANRSAFNFIRNSD